MSIAEPYSRSTQRYFQLGMFLSLMFLNGMVLLLLWLANSQVLADPNQPAAKPESAMGEQLDQLRAMARPTSVMHYYANFIEESAAHQGDTPAQQETFLNAFLTAVPGVVFVKIAAIAVLFAGLILLSLALAIYGLVRFLRGPPLARRWQRWQRGVVSPLPLWQILAACFFTVVGLLLVRSTLASFKSVFAQLAVWEATQAVLVIALMIVAGGATGLHPWRDFGFGREPFKKVIQGLKYYFALLPLFWIMALAGALLFGLVDAAAGAPKDIDDTSRLTLDKIIQPGNDPWGPLALFTAAVILAPIFEELFFRGFLYGGLRRWMSAPAAMVLSAAVFAGMHPMQNHLPIFFLGMFLAYNYEKTGNLGASMAVHFTHNFIVMCLMGLAFL